MLRTSKASARLGVSGRSAAPASLVVERRVVDLADQRGELLSFRHDTAVKREGRDFQDCTIQGESTARIELCMVAILTWSPDRGTTSRVGKIELTLGKNVTTEGLFRSLAPIHYLADVRMSARAIVPP